MAAECLIAFAARFIRDISHHRDVRTEPLAEAFRCEFGLSKFPRYKDLLRACKDAGIIVAWLPATAPMEGANAWVEGRSPMISLRVGLPIARAETTLCHELREVIETAIKRAEHAYVGLATHENAHMNPRSDRFGGHLLMHSGAARERLAANGFDFITFARDTRRSIASVVTRAQELFPRHFHGSAPVAGLWLYEAPSSLLQGGGATLATLCVTQESQLMGFSTAKAGRESAVAAAAFPTRWASAQDADVVRDAVVSGQPSSRAVGGFDLFGDRDFTVVAEPLFVRDLLRQVLLTAIRNDSLALTRPWLHRLNLPTTACTFPGL